MIRYEGKDALREARNLHHQKGFRPSVGNGVPSPSEGSDGDVKFNSTIDGMKMFVKHQGQWVSFSPDSGGYGIQAPDHDSGWVTVTKGSSTTVYNVNHNLNSQLLLVHGYLNDTTNNRMFSLHSGVYDYFSANANEVGLWFHLKDNNNIDICTGNDYVYIYDNTSASATSVKLTSADVRLFIWKINGY